MSNYHQRFTFDSFIKAIDADLINRYFTEKSITIPAGVSVNNPDEARKLIAGCDRGKQLVIDEELRRVNDLAVKQAEKVMEVINEYEIEYVEGEKPITTCLRVYFCDDKDAFDELYDFYLYGLYSERLYYYRFDQGQYEFSEEGLDTKVEKFQEEMAEHFKNDGKGDDCVIRTGKDGDEHFFIIMRGNGMKMDYEFAEKKVRMLSFHQAKQELVVFNPKTGTISVTSGIRKMDDKKKYVESFGVNILGLSEVPEMTFKEELVKADPLKEDSFYQPTTEIEKITVKQAVLLRRGQVFTTITVKSDDVMASLNQMRFKLEYYVIKSMALRFKLHNIKKEIPVEIIPPEHTEIKHREGSEIIKKYLQDKGVLLV